MSPTSTPTKFGIILFPGFQLLDATGPLDALNLLATSHPLTLSIIAETLTPVSTRTDPQTMVGSVFAQSIVPTHTFSTAPRDLEVLILPGGLGTRDGSAMEAVVEFLRGYGIAKWGKGADKGKWVVTVCTGSEVLARTGVLDGKRATTNKRGFNGIKATHPSVHWVPKARWVVDGNFWTSSGISAGIDVAFAWIAAVYGEDVAQGIADRSEYERNVDAGADRFAELWGAE